MDYVRRMAAFRVLMDRAGLDAYWLVTGANVRYLSGFTGQDSGLLVTGSRIGGSLAVYDALSGEFLRRVSSGNLTVHTLHTPWGGAP